MGSLAASHSKTYRKGHFSFICSLHCKIHPHHNIIFLIQIGLRRKQIKLPEIFFCLLYLHNDQHAFRCCTGKAILRCIITTGYGSHSGSMTICVCGGHQFHGILQSKGLINLFFPENSSVRHRLFFIPFQCLIPDT